jgi:hypothetical protein
MSTRVKPARGRKNKREKIRTSRRVGCKVIGREKGFMLFVETTIVMDNGEILAANRRRRRALI